MTTAAFSVPDFFHQLFSYREFLRQSVIRDLRTKYKRSVLGYVWTMLHPLAMMSILAIVFANIMKVPMRDYGVFLFCGILPFNFFSSTVLMSLGSIRANSRLFSQVPIPKYIFVLSITFSNLFNFVLALVPLLILMVAFGRPISPTVLLFPVVVFPLVCTTIGVALVLATSNVFFEDTLHLSEVALQATYFLSPVLYHRDQLPAEIVRVISVVNPLFNQIEFIRSIFYEGVAPDPLMFIGNVVLSLVVLTIGLWVFQRSEHKFLYFV